MFPYYIVRFKHIQKKTEISRHCGFHTTQYDLNFIFYIGCISYFFCFHTTQYDLNHLWSATILGRNISFHTTQYDLNNFFPKQCLRRKPEFPYYIVRFKHAGGMIMQHAKHRFHTTQYDLNRENGSTKHSTKKFPYYIVRFKHNICNYSEDIKMEFPYYIVRFKPKYSQVWDNDVKRFHTTQYDLNIRYGLMHRPERHVSILHSTI